MFFILLVVSLMSFLHDFHVSSCDENCADKPVFTPSRLVVKHGDPTSATCSVKDVYEIFNLERSLGDLKTNGTEILWKVEKMTEWDMFVMCYYELDHQCCSTLPITVYKPPDNVSISFRDHSGPLLEGHQYTLQCEVHNVAPVENLTVTFYRGQTALGQLQSSNTGKKPVTEIFTLNINTSKEDDGVQYWCEAKLELGPEGPQPPLVVTSEKFSSPWTIPSTSSTPIPSFKPPDSVSFSFRNHSGPLLEGHQYTLQCEVHNVAPVENLTVTFYRGQTALGQLQSNNTEKKPVTEIFSLNINTRKEHDGVQYWCEAKLELGPEGPQPPPVATSEKFSATVNSTPASGTTPSTSSTLIPSFKPPDNVSISFRDHSGPLLEGHQYTLQCEVHNVAPVENLTVTFYRGQTALGQLQSNNTEKKPVTEIFTLNINTSKEDDGVQYWCEAKLELGPEGPQPPLVVTSEKFSSPWTIPSTSSTPIPSFKPPDSVSFSFRDHSGPLLEGHQYTLQCEVHNVAPVENLIVTFYRGQTALGQLQSNNTEKKPVTEIFSLNINTRKEHDGVQYWCEAKLELGPEGPQPPPVVTSEKFSATVNSTPAPGTTPSTSSTPTPSFKPPDSVSIGFNYGRMLKYRQYSLLCKVQKVAPVENVIVTLYRGQTALCQLQSNNTEKKPVTEIFSLNINTSKEDDGVQYWCEAKLELGPEGPQPPPVVMSEKFSSPWTIPSTSSTPIPSFKPPDNVSISFRDHSGPLLEGHQYTLQCEVHNVAPVENLIVTFYRGQTALGQLQSNNTEKKPVTEIFTLSINTRKEHDGVQYWCEAKLELGPEGPQPPPVVTSEKFSATVNSTPASGTTPSTSSTLIPSFKPPDSVSIGFNYGRMRKYGQCTLLCKVQKVAPVENLSVTFYRGQTALGQLQSNNTEKKPVTEIFTLNINNGKEDDGVQYWCEAKLELGPKGPQPPLVVTSEKFSSPWTIPSTSSTPIPSFKPPDNVSISFRDHSGPLLEGHQYTLQCEVHNVAPVENLTVTFYRGQTALGQLQSNNIEKKPVTEILTLSINTRKKMMESSTGVKPNWNWI
ncbi:uncharacterized protein LOC108875749 [Lates calcarifer]|uniref:Uncharacterized protein LOC108875749 n=1 Tax=Lates calcarifer TaxID=8187 RepID=A0AAJ8B494_LATCA|nr:uncharacterized protein LOC108875749 [Lates calcarifer]